MAGTSAGAAKAIQTKLSVDPEVFSKMGKKGGGVKNSNKGFGSNKRLAKALGKQTKRSKNKA